MEKCRGSAYQLWKGVPGSMKCLDCGNPMENIVPHLTDGTLLDEFWRADDPRLITVTEWDENHGL